eukprot:CCRYP_016357-RA/>CCRYP_016357-RA protein AED:0.06 eAED:0.26 QI:0/0/0/1/0/0/2/0/230
MLKNPNSVPQKQSAWDMCSLQMVLNHNNKKVQAILALTPPTGVKDLRRFLGMVQYYQALWAKCSNMLAPLTSLVGEFNKTMKRPWYWDMLHQKAFNDAKTTIATDVVLAYPGSSRDFEIYTYALSKQLGSVVTQGNRPLVFFSRKLLTSQQKYSVTELELLAKVVALKELRGMLWGQRLKVYTDHKNLIQDALRDIFAVSTDGGFSSRNSALNLFTLKAHITLLPTPSLA